MEQLGLDRQPPDPNSNYHWDYASLANPPVIPGGTPSASSIYRGLVPAKNILNRDFALNGAMVLGSVESWSVMPPLTTAHSHKQFSGHHAYMCEVSAHWISAYFRHDAMRLPQSVEEALEATEHDAAWVRQRYPYALRWMDESNSGAVAFWT
jgi:dimethylaniline monooxygenase (N-oxide forming)